jgi:hypothetical protein
MKGMALVCGIPMSDPRNFTGRYGRPTTGVISMDLPNIPIPERAITKRPDLGSSIERRLFNTGAQRGTE